ncbi:hypothetical protein RZN22_04935 [Bacillaceae bacterium S4-13-58]
MDTYVGIYQINNAIDQVLPENVKQNDLCIYRFIGGNVSETDELTEQLYS